ncbi:MAG: Clp1/GlmU family protein [Anaerolineales bacterium]
MPQELQIPSTWHDLDLAALRGVVMITGATDTGKSTLAQYLFQQLAEQGEQVAFLDGDPGQSQLGPPTTINLALAKRGDSTFPPKGANWRRFVGSTTPTGHMLPLVAGEKKLVVAGKQAGAERIIHDTTGLIDPSAGGAHLKWSTIDLLGVKTVIGLAREEELESLLKPLRQRTGMRVVELAPAEGVRRRGDEERRKHRAGMYRAYFRGAEDKSLDWSQLAVYPGPEFTSGRLMGLMNADDFCLGLAVVISGEPETREIRVLTPVESFGSVDALHLADVSLDVRSYRDQLLH